MEYNIVKEKELGRNILSSLYINDKLILKGFGLMYEKELNRFSFYRFKTEDIPDNYNIVILKNCKTKSPLQMYFYPEENELFFITKQGKSIFLKIDKISNIQSFLLDEEYLLYDNGYT